MPIRRHLAVCLAICFLTLFIGLRGDPALAHGKAEVAPKTGILLVAFGTSVPEARVAYKALEAKVKTAHPGVEVRWAYTARSIRHTLAAEGLALHSPAGALGRMLDDGFTHVAVQSLHIIPGQEYHDLAATVQAFGSIPKGFARLVLGPPLLGGPEDMSALAKAVLGSIPALGENEALVLVGHGTHHLAAAFYPAMHYYLQQESRRALVGTIEGTPSIEDVLAELARIKATKVRLLPFMTVAGEHAHNDIAGDDPDSWNARLKAQGIACRPSMRGLAEVPAVADIWVGQLGRSLETLRAEPQGHGH